MLGGLGQKQSITRNNPSKPGSLKNKRNDSKSSGQNGSLAKRASYQQHQQSSQLQPATSLSSPKNSYSKMKGKSGQAVRNEHQPQTRNSLYPQTKLSKNNTNISNGIVLPMKNIRSSRDHSISQQPVTGAKTDSSVESQSRYLVSGKIRGMKSSNIQQHQAGSFEVGGASSGVAGQQQFSSQKAAVQYIHGQSSAQNHNMIPTNQYIHHSYQQQMQLLQQPPKQQQQQQQSQSLIMSRNSSPAKVQIKKSSIDFYHNNQNHNQSAQSSQKSIGVSPYPAEPIRQQNKYLLQQKYEQLRNAGKSTGVSPPMKKSSLNMRQNYLVSSNVASSSQQHSSSSRSPPQTQISNMNTVTGTGYPASSTVSSNIQSLSHQQQQQLMYMLNNKMPQNQYSQLGGQNQHQHQQHHHHQYQPQLIGKIKTPPQNSPQQKQQKVKANNVGLIGVQPQQQLLQSQDRTSQQQQQIYGTEVHPRGGIVTTTDQQQLQQQQQQVMINSPDTSLLMAGAGLSQGLSVDNVGSMSGQTEIMQHMISPDQNNVLFQVNSQKASQASQSSKMIKKKHSSNVQQQTKFKLVNQQQTNSNSGTTQQQPSSQLISQTNSKANSRGSSITNKSQRGGGGGGGHTKNSGSRASAGQNPIVGGKQTQVRRSTQMLQGKNSSSNNNNSYSQMHQKNNNSQSYNPNTSSQSRPSQQPGSQQHSNGGLNKQQKTGPKQQPTSTTPQQQQPQQQPQQQQQTQQEINLQAQMLEQIQNMIKNGKKHLSPADLEKEQMVSTLREFLVNMTNQLGDMPQAYNSSQVFDQMIQDMLKMKFSSEAQKHLPGQKGNGPTQRAQSLSNYQSSQSQQHQQQNIQQKTVSQAITPATRKVMQKVGPNGNSIPAGKQGTVSNNASSHGSRKSTDSRAYAGNGNGGQPPKTYLKHHVKINKPTFNLQINNNVGSVNNTDGGAMTQITLGQLEQIQVTNNNTAASSYPQQADPPKQDPITTQIGYLNAQKLLEAVQQAAEQQKQQQIAANLKKQKRTSSEDNVNQQIKMQQLRSQAEQEAKHKQDQQRATSNMQQTNNNQNIINTSQNGNAVNTQSSVNGVSGHRRGGFGAGGSQSGPGTVKTRKNLPSLANSKNGSRGTSNTSSNNPKDQIQFAVQVNQRYSNNNTSTRQGQASNPGSTSGTANTSTVPFPQQQSYLNSHLQNTVLGNSSKLSSALSSGLGVGSTSAGEIAQTNSGSTNNSRVNTTKLQVDDTLLKERDELISYIKNYIAKNNELPPTTLEFYKFVKLIGKGAFGKVTLGMHKLTGKSVAIKTIEKQYMRDEFSKRKVFQEVYLLKKIKHSNVIRLLEVFESSKHLLMVMEYAGGGDLLKLIKKRGGLKEQDSKFIFKQIVYGLSHIHCRSVIHRDIKLDNILLDCEKGVKICDFGVSKIIKKGQVIKEQCGTPAYLAPEIIIDTGYEGFFVDIWSLGVLLFAMLCGTVPFKAPTLDDLHRLILAGEFAIPDQLSIDAKELIRGMIQLEPTNRLTIPQILNHSWLKDTNEMGSESEEEEQEQENPPNDDQTGEKDKQNDDGTNNKQVVKGGKEVTNVDKDGGAVDLTSIHGNVNYVNVDNLFYHENYKNKLSYIDYCCITEDFTSQILDEEAIKVCENFGFPRHFMIKCLNRGDINHATACYFLLTNSS